jgi:tRNA threonylcarbamoyladenosine biosynthesis protein TsaB
LPENIQRQITQQQTIAPHAKAMLRLVKLGQIDPVNAAEALPVYVRNQVTQGAVSHG